VQGGQQGDFEASSGFYKTTKRLFDEADSTLAPAGGCASATCDDLTLRGPARIAWEVHAALKRPAALASVPYGIVLVRVRVLKRDAKAQLGLGLQETKAEYHAPLPERRAMFLQV